MHTTTPAIMIQGTCSNAGKSLLTAGLCRVFADAGLRPAPFKAQNMALNSFVTADGEELGRAQALQALACGLPPDIRMNPVLLKPCSDTGSQVIVMGRPVGHMRVSEYIRYKEQAFASVSRAYDSLAAEAGVMVLEGAGSPAEINLQAHDIVNMRMAHYARAPVLLAGDIDRGGVFAALVGTMALLPEADQRQVAGFILNKFRGDASLLTPALESISARTGKPFVGVVPWLPDLGLPEEDSVNFKLHVNTTTDARGDTPQAPVDIVLLDLPHISNATDIDPLRIEPDVRVRVVSRVEVLGQPDAIILPGSKSTLTDLRALRDSGMAEAVCAAHRRPGGPMVVGICGGLQMLGLEVHDPHSVESTAPDPLPALGLLPLITVMGQDKILRRTQALHCGAGEQVRGYEIHHGHTSTAAGQEELVRPCLLDAQGQAIGWERLPAPNEKTNPVWGTYLHGIFDEDGFRRAFVDTLRSRKNLPPLGRLTAYTLEPALDRLAQCLREHLDMERIFQVLRL